MRHWSVKQNTTSFFVGVLVAALAPSASIAETGADAKNMELVTVTTNQAVITWDSEMPTQGLVRYKRSDDEQWHEARELNEGTRFHRVELTGLQPGSSYLYSIEVDSIPVDPGEYSPGQFTTLVAPPGRKLFTFATITDMHVGLQSAGLIGATNFQPVDCPLDQTTCWEEANTLVVEAINRSNAAFTIVKGDLTQDFEKSQFESARTLLDRLVNPYYVVRGNHDRQGEQPEDYFEIVFGAGRDHVQFSEGSIHFLALDTSDRKTGFPAIGGEQFEWLQQTLMQTTRGKIFLITHHPVTQEASYIFSIFPDDQEQLFSILKDWHNLIGILSGHSHRNWVTHQPELGGTPCVETASSMHYPGGYNLYDVYSGGYIQSYHKVNSPDWREWEEAGRAMYNGDAQKILFGSLEHRNFVYLFDTPLPDDDTGGCGCTQTQSAGEPTLLLYVIGLLIVLKARYKCGPVAAGTSNIGVFDARFPFR